MLENLIKLMWLNLIHSDVFIAVRDKVQWAGGEVN